jgi:hypothetical protein
MKRGHFSVHTFETNDHECIKLRGEFPTFTDAFNAFTTFVGCENNWRVEVHDDHGWLTLQYTYTSRRHPPKKKG